MRLSVDTTASPAVAPSAAKRLSKTACEGPPGSGSSCGVKEGPSKRKAGSKREQFAEEQIMRILKEGDGADNIQAICRQYDIAEQRY
jgi:hypothetical protein